MNMLYHTAIEFFRTNYFVYTFSILEEVCDISFPFDLFESLLGLFFI